ncbi:hypothetical protein ACEQ8H_002241 [Pleosporales sp. CAS-2024a]
MNWSLATSDAPEAEPKTYQLPHDRTAHIVVDAQGLLGIVHELHSEVHTELGQIVIGAWGAKLEAITEPLLVRSSTTGSKIPEKESYRLQPRGSQGSEILFLRPGDAISSPNVTASLTCVLQISAEVQVTSSAGDLHVKAQSNALDGVAETPEEETEDEDHDDTVLAVTATQSKSRQPRATPQLSYQPSVVVQETPTLDRMTAVKDYPANTEELMDQPKLLEQTPRPDTPDRMEAEPFATARTGQSQHHSLTTTDQKESHTDIADIPEEDTSTLNNEAVILDSGPRKPQPRVVVKSRKRPSPEAEESASPVESLGRSAKRPRRNLLHEDDNQDAHMNIVVDTSPVSVTGKKKGRPRKSALKDIDDAVEATPSRSHRSSQRSLSTAVELYSGETPRVATSNSSITDKSQAVKFLKKQGGSFIESGKESFNVLCVRDGDLYKTSKLLQAIATGTPIVTDKWLTDSAKAGHFLSVDAYRPSVPKQEEEWRFQLADVICQPQTPFQGYTVHFTTNAHALYKPFTEIEQVCKAAGAEKVTKKKMDRSGKVIVLAVEGEDKEAERLMQDGVACYSRHLLSMSIIRGTLDLESDEFKIGTGPEDYAAGATRDTRTKRGRK